MTQKQKLEILVENYIKNMLSETSAIDKSYTHFLLDKESNKIIDGWDYKDLDGFSVAQYVDADLKDKGLNKKDVSVLTIRQAKSNNIDPFDHKNWKKINEEDLGSTDLDKFNLDINTKAMKPKDPQALDKLIDKLFDGSLDSDQSNLKKLKTVLTTQEHPDKKAALELIDKKLRVSEDTIITTVTGDSSTATPDQKKKIQLATQKGDTVKIVKKGTLVTEKKEDEPAPSVEPDEVGMEDRVKPKSPNKLSNGIEEHIQEAIKSLFDSSEASEDDKYKKLSNAVLKHLNRALEAFNKINEHDTKLSEQAMEQDEKLGNKAVISVEKHLAKKVKNKEDIPHIMNKYSKVVKKLKDKPTESIANAVWKHVLKENSNI